MIVRHMNRSYTRQEAEAEIRDEGLHEMVFEVPAVDNEPHWHDFDAYLRTRPEVARATMEEIFESGDYHPYLQPALTRATEAEGVPEEHERYPEYLAATADLQAAVLAAMDIHLLAIFWVKLRIFRQQRWQVIFDHITFLAAR